MKKILSVLASVALLVSAIVPCALHAFAAEPLKAHLFVQGVQTGKQLKEVSGLYDDTFCEDVTSTFTGVDSMVGYTNEPAIEFNNTNVIDNFDWDTQCSLSMNNLTPNGNAFVFYVKLPAGATHELFFNVNVAEGRRCIKSGESYSTLSVRGSKWETGTVLPWASDDTDGKIALPAGFEGYVRIPIDTLYDEPDNKDSEKITSTSQITRLGLRVSNYGGSLGAAYFGPIMVQENDSDSTQISLYDGTSSYGEAADLNSKNDVINAIQAHSFLTEIEADKPLSDVDIWQSTGAGTSTFSGVSSMVDYDTNAAVAFDSNSIVDNVSSPNRCCLNVNKAINGKAFIVYVSVSDKTDHYFYFCANANNGWQRLKSGEKYQILSDDASAWEEKTVEPWSPTDTDGKIPLPAGFKGHIRIPVEDMYWHAGQKEAEHLKPTDTITQMGMNFSNYGGDDGTCYAGPVMVDENMTDSTMIKLNGAEAAKLQQEDKNVIKAHSFLTEIQANKPLSDVGIWQSTGAGTSTFKGVPSMVDYDTNAAVAFDSDSIVDSVAGANRCCLNVNKAINGQAFIVYVSVSDKADHYFYFCASANNGWQRLKSGEKYQILPDNATEWEEKTVEPWSPTDTDGKIPLPAGFSGHIRIPVENMYWHAGQKDAEHLKSTDTITQMGMNFSNYGGDYGTCYAGPVMVDENMMDSTKIKLNDGTPVQMQQPVASSDDMEAEIVSKYGTASVGDDLVAAKLGKVESGAKITLKGVHSPVGYNKYPVASVDCKDGVSISDADLTGTLAAFHLTIDADADDMDSLMFYIKVPNKANKAFLVFEINQNWEGVATSWPRVEAGNAYSLLKKGDTTWTQKTAAAAGTDGLLEFDAGFEGYVKIPKDSITWAAAGLQTSDIHHIGSLLFRFSDYGGDNGPIVMGPFLKVITDKDTNVARIDGSTTPIDLFKPSNYDPSKPLVNFQAMSDTHVDDYGGGALSIGAKNMKAALQDIKTNFPNTDAILHGGDLTEIGSAAQYSQAYSYFKQYSPTNNILAAIGNHDIRGNLNTEGGVSYDDMLDRFLTANSQYVDSNGKPYYDQWINGYHFIVLGTDQKLKDCENIGEEQMAWFTEKVKEGARSDKPIFVLTHDPLLGTFSNNSGDCLIQTDDMMNIIKKYPQIILFTGHTHDTDPDNYIIDKGQGVFVDMPSLHNSNRPAFPNDEYNHMYYNVEAYADRVEIHLYDFNLGKDVWVHTVKTADFGKGAEDEPEAPKDKVLKAETMDTLSGLNVGDTVTPYFGSTHNGAAEKGVTKITISDPLNELTGKNTIKIDSESEIVRPDIYGQTQHDLGFGKGTGDFKKPVSLKNGQAFLMYVKMPTGDNGTGKNSIFFNVQNSDRGGGSQAWNNLTKGEIVKYLAKDTNKWESEVIDEYGVVVLPAGFEGYIYAPFNALIDGATTNPLDDSRYIQHFGVSLGYFGGKYGPFYMDPVLLATNDVLSKDGVMLDGSEKISNLFSGKEMQLANVYEDPSAAPEIGSIHLDLPESTTDAEIHEVLDEDVTSTSAKISWDPTDGATKYRVDLYKSAFGAAGLTYTYMGNKVVTGTSCEFTGLTPSTHYYVVVNALDADGQIIAVYDNASVTTVFASDEKPSNPSKPSNPGSSTGNGSTSGNGSKTDDVKTGVNAPAGIAVVALLSLAGIATSRKKKEQD